MVEPTRQKATLIMPTDHTQLQRMQERYDDLRDEGKHGHYECMFRVWREEFEIIRQSPASDCATHDGATMIETVARAICRQEHITRYGSEVWRKGELEAKINFYWPRHVKSARAAIEAMREPTETMVSAANRNNHPRDIDTWRTMIDAALATRASDPAP
jgi:hypothetical protein